MVLRGLGVDQVGHQRAGVPAEEQVGERAVAPEETLDVDPDEQDDGGVDQAAAQAVPPSIPKRYPNGRA